jgi:anti-sigma regulatory factor (Ser/Thr protein kinase)
VGVTRPGAATSSGAAAASSRALRHEALFYAGPDDFIGRTAAFVRDGVQRGEPVLVVVSAPKIAGLRSALGDGATRVQFADMAEVGRNPARIIAAWRTFVGEHGDSGRALRGVGEPIDAQRSEPAMAECHRHEALLNVALAADPIWLVCPYDTSTLDQDVIDHALVNHPYVLERDHSSPSTGYVAPAADFDDPLPDLPFPSDQLAYEAATLHELRRYVAAIATRYGFDERRVDAIVLAANEVATNSLRHGGGVGTLRTCVVDGSLVCEFRDRGHIDDQPLVGRLRPRAGQVGGHGLWLANQLCDLVQVRSNPQGTVVRLHMSCDARLGT